ncbi:MOSC domain-containing protein [Pelagicoccus albus]|uniref:Molybdenum cofactor biosysynthesis protein n=1 Tax=Pelagicoccus albus TaxID=415222 RepID=A0A7X1B7F7_9BACT|nr:MOSC domain-containing protein [Pelagicoccus albus]MBC2605773.1 molybdenum cofactor biosysynthesis protein [Pelagicoccus albus]
MSQTLSIHHIYLSKGHDFKGRFGKERRNHEVSEVESVECVAGKGLVGDRYFGYKEDFKGQLSLMSMEAIGALESELGLKNYRRSDFRRNILLSGVDLNALVGQIFRLGAVELEGVEQCKPCFWMDEAIGEGAFAAMAERGGLRCRILRGGILGKGQVEMEVLEKHDG